ncbi:Predicted oxidoreductase [Halopenitus malekzadehii]|uniref:Predicted oxidoreductase n=1 Tax=Halopenitus malekzadehii TaxID=1267564 RepID=A0A1H6HV34_9EURY|nr:aldo/keto reductase [Halopenitus malekzadehii]SEH38942.1 Predicted oxidoreductase [Halopenitus malekzadehii]
MATREGTWRYRERFGDAFGRTYFRRFGPGVASSVGIGTYLGDPTDAVDDRYRESIRLALESGVNHVDTASNYRCGRSERVVGEALSEAAVDRESVVVASKAGFVPFDGERPDDPAAYVREEFLETGILSADDLVHGSHAIAPGFIETMLDRSLDAIGVETIDCYYVHNPETQLAERSPEEVYDALETAFERLERRRLAGDIGGYGVATWDAFRVPPDHDSALSLPAIIERAERAAATVGADDHGFRAVQLPFNVRMADAFTRPTQPTSSADADRCSLLERAHKAGVDVVTSASLGQGSLAEPGAIPEPIADQLAGETPAQRAINFARSAPGVTTALVGARDPDHVRENVAAGTFDPLGANAFDAVFE